MDTEFSKVSLGFAEFVGKLIHETFDAVVSSQNYQFNKHEELQEALNSSVVKFEKLHLHPEETASYILDTYGLMPTAGGQVTEELVKKLKFAFTDAQLESILSKNRFTQLGVELLTANAVQKLVALKKQQLQQMLNFHQATRIVVDSGEIKAKVELYCLNESLVSNKNSKKSRSNSDSMPKVMQSFSVNSIVDSGGNKTPLLEVLDSVTQTKTLIIDKKKIPSAVGNFDQMPGTRLVVNPATPSSSTAFFSEITIKFKTV